MNETTDHSIRFSERKIKALESLLKRFRQRLWLSVLTNILLIALLLFAGRPQKLGPGLLDFNLSHASERLPYIPASQGIFEVRQQLRSFSFKQLVAKLKDRRSLGSGISYRELALACLAKDHYFDVLRALGGIQPNSDVLTLEGASGEREELLVYTHLFDWQYRELMRFGKEASWPFSNQGLYVLLCEEGADAAGTLRRAFYMTPEFQALEGLMRYEDAKVRRQDLLSILLSGTWDSLSAYAQQCRRGTEAPEVMRREMLLDYLDCGSTVAAKLLLRIEMEHLLERASEEEVLAVVRSLKRKGSKAEGFALALLKGPRGPRVWEAAACLLYEISDEEPPQPYDHLEALLRFSPELALAQDLKFHREHQDLVPIPVKVKRVERTPYGSESLRRYWDAELENPAPDGATCRLGHWVVAPWMPRSAFDDTPDSQP